MMIDGTPFGDQQLITALGVTVHGQKLVLGLRQGATENATVVKQLLADLQERGVDFEVPRLYVLDGGKALFAGVRQVAGKAAVVQRCHIHIAGRNPRFPEGWNVPSRASPYEPGSLRSDMVGYPELLAGS